MEAARKLKTYEDLLAIPEEVRAELLAGEIIAQPGGLSDHSRVQRSMSRFIGGPFDDDTDGPDGWWIFLEMDVRFTRHDVTRPDLVGWRRSRLPAPAGMRPIDVVPDWICEVLSPSNARHDRVFKARLYAEHGVPYYWLIDPAERTLEAYVLRDSQWLRAGAWDDTEVARVPPFEAIELPVGRLFFPRPPT
ncbi:Uma2 family endonuclease [Nannocystis bainbridge]|uniref:Uma2 family endonuclease n=1 Tax=Nannocystis bainbridge TaxID=2995303 RepID=A0ABT5DXV5_9BACT|nr:Uma2 family endonuclease [Nannocystis bainbridge]MDC0717271.1 Uma2 family endonuclease [Nannocystis bainbridge]